jgi:MFS family permease
MRQLLLNRNARLYLSGQVMSLFGDSSLWLAMAIWTKVLTGSFSAVGLSWFALAVGSLFGPLGGMLADRARRRPMLVATNLATAGLVLLLLLVRDRHQVWLIYLVMFGYGVSGSLLGPAQTALVQAIVPGDLLAMRTARSRRRSKACAWWRRWQAQDCSPCSAPFLSSSATRPPSWSPLRRC